MKSKLVPGYDFNYTFDSVLQSEYENYFYKHYEINRIYIENHIEELIRLPDVFVHLPGTVGKAKKFISERYELDLDVSNGKLGLYQWFNLFGKLHRGQNYEDTKEDYCRIFLDLVKKYPEHSDIIQQKEVLGDIYDNSPNFDDSFERKVDLFREKLKPIEQMVDKVYSNLINEDLIYLDDYVPRLFLSDYASEKREKHLLAKYHSFDIPEFDSMSDKFEMENMDEAMLKIMFELDDFIEKYPQYSQLIPDYDAFVKYGDEIIGKLKKEGGL